MFGTALNPAFLIRKQWIAKEFVASDLIFLGRRDEDFNDGYRPHIMEMSTLRDIILEELSITDLTDTPQSLGNPGEILVVNQNGDELEWQDLINTFIELTDTPADYTGFAGFNVSVNQTEDGLEFTPPTVLTPRWEGRLSFNGAVNPIIDQQLVSALGVNVTWQRTALGVYQATFSGIVDPDKLIAYHGTSSSGSFVIGAYTANFIQFIHRDFTGAPSDPNGIVAFEIKLYP